MVPLRVVSSACLLEKTVLIAFADVSTVRLWGLVQIASLSISRPCLSYDDAFGEIRRRTVDKIGFMSSRSERQNRETLCQKGFGPSLSYRKI